MVPGRIPNSSAGNDHTQTPEGLGAKGGLSPGRGCYQLSPMRA